MTEEAQVLYEIVKNSEIKKILALIGIEYSWIKLDEIECRRGVVSVYYDIEEGKLVFQEEDEDGCSIYDTKDCCIKHKEYD